MKGLPHVKSTLLKYSIIIMGKFYTTSLLASNRGANSCKIFPDIGISTLWGKIALLPWMLLESGVKFPLIVKYKIEFYK